MARQLKSRAAVRVHQALHGYADGHRLLALSATLKPRDQKTLLALSDISGAGAKLDPHGYLTGYPLQESSVFAFARTWPAHEMPRPGCVWTHTLLIDFVDLAEMPSLHDLLVGFHRPQDAAHSQRYAQPMEIKSSAAPSPSQLPLPLIRSAMAGLYEFPSFQIVATDSESGSEDAVVALWTQQWPRLRRSFRFCTFALGDRSVDGVPFDLLVAPAGIDRGLRGRFAKSLDLDRAVARVPRWIDSAAEDIRWPDKNGLRGFLRRVGSDVSGGREAFGKLCELHEAIRSVGEDGRQVSRAIGLLRDEFALDEARSARISVTQAILSAIDDADEQALRFVLDSLKLLDERIVRERASEIGRALWRLDASELDDARVPDEIVAGAIDELPIEELAVGLANAPALAGKALQRRPEIVREAAFWEQALQIESAVLSATRSGLQVEALAAAIRSKRADLPAAVSPLVGSAAVMDALCVVGEPWSGAWLKTALADLDGVATFLASGRSIERSMLSALAKMLAPDSVPNEYGEDPWLVAWRGSGDDIKPQSSEYLRAFFLSRALGTRSRSQAGLVRVGFEPLHRAVLRADVLDEWWDVLEPRLPAGKLWERWDRAERLRTAVVWLFVERNLDVNEFVACVSDDGLFRDLSVKASSTRRGRNYLERLTWSLDSPRDDAIEKRLAIVKSVLRDAW